MTKIEYSGRTCKDCGTTMLVHNPRQIFACEECEKAWSMESLNDWSGEEMPPDTQFSYSDLF